MGHVLEKIYELLGQFVNSRFIIFIDDLSFEKIDSDYQNNKIHARWQYSKSTK